MPRRSAILLVALLLVSGCLGAFDQRPPSDDRAVDLRGRVVDAVGDTSTYRFDSRVHVYASKGEESRSVTVDAEGAVDADRRIVAATSETEDESRRSYVENYTSYTECGDPWDGWGVEELDPSRPWRNYTTLGRQLSILSQSRVYWRGSEPVDGNRTLVVVAHPTKDTLNSVADGANDAAVGPRGLQNATLKLWVDPDTALPVKSRLQVEVKRNGATATATVRTEFAGYGEPVNATVPPSVHTDQYELGCPGA